MSNRIETLITEIVDAEVVRLRGELLDEFRFVFGECQSPIERMMVAALHHSIRVSYMENYWDREDEQRIQMIPHKAIHADPDWATYDIKHGGIYIVTQARIEKFHADILVNLVHPGRLNLRVAVECDGHDFHERTKEQARRDRSRDRAFQSLGIPVYRFTGSEIYRDPVACAAEVVKFMEDKQYAALFPELAQAA